MRTQILALSVPIPVEGRDRTMPQCGCQRAKERRPRQAITDRVLAADRIDSTDAAEPIDRMDAKDPTLPAERAEPTLPIDSTESLDAMHRTLPGELMLRRLRRSDIGS